MTSKDYSRFRRTPTIAAEALTLKSISAGAVGHGTGIGRIFDDARC
jgi:hypothetical protein